MAEIYPNRERQHLDISETYLGAAHVLEEAQLRHCIVGDATARILGTHDLLIGTMFVCVAEEHLEAGYAALLERGFQPTTSEQFTDQDSDETWGGRFFLPRGATDTLVTIVIVPASAWYFSLDPPTFETNTYCYPHTHHRYPTQLFYAQGLIQALVDRWPITGRNLRITNYFLLQYAYVKEFLAPKTIALFSPEDQLFIDLFNKTTSSGKKQLCDWHKRIRGGQATVEEAKKSIPRPDLKIAALKRKHQARNKDRDKENQQL